MKTLSILLIIFLSFATNQVLADVPTCHSGSGGYCTYTGKVERIYVNSGNLILLYFDTPVDIGAPASVGYTVTKGNAAAFQIDSNPEFAKLFYSTALAAQASGREVTMQMRGVQSGFLQFDRISVAAP